MKYLSEYRNPELIQFYIKEIHKVTKKPWNIMEVCGGQTHSLVKNGILDILPQSIQMIHGPGCPVCVTPLKLIDKAIRLLERNVIVCSFGDMVRVPGSEKSFLEAKAEGGDLRIVYSPLEAVYIARDNPDKEIVFFAVGFETTAPSNALAVLHSEKLGLDNFSLLVSHVLVPPAMEAILEDKLCNVNGFLAAGHVCAVMGTQEYKPLVERYKIPVVVTGFEPVDLIEGIYLTIKQLEEGNYLLENQYSRIVKPKGNKAAKEVIAKIFKTGAREWRGIGEIPKSGYLMREKYEKYNAEVKFELNQTTTSVHNLCMAGEIIKGKKKPKDCPQFGEACIPQNPLGAPMVSSEGACAAYYNFSI